MWKSVLKLFEIKSVKGFDKITILSLSVCLLFRVDTVVYSINFWSKRVLNIYNKRKQKILIFYDVEIGNYKSLLFTLVNKKHEALLTIWQTKSD